jgi:fibronectin type 3 domain-containing protein
MKEIICRYASVKTRCVFALVCSIVAFCTQSWATDPKFYAVQVSASVQESPAQVTLSWTADPNASSYTVYRKSPSAGGWTQLVTLPASALSYIDNNVTVGSTYEYQVYRPTPWNYKGYGYVSVGIKAPLVDSRGKVLLLVDNTYAADLAVELSRLQRDLAGDGWTVIRRDVARSASAATVKNIIKTEYNADAANLKSVFIFGHVAVPYSGNLNPDGHYDHHGAWPADTYYADVDGSWTDSSVNNTSSPRAQTKNVPGDGKFDQSSLPSNVELQVGRVDLANMTSFTSKGISEKELLRRYLNKNHNFRHTITKLERRGLICDNFDEAGGEAFASSGWRNFSAFFGANNVTKVGQSQFFPTLGSQSYLWSYGCGGGYYDSCYGVGNTVDFANTDIKSAFVMLLGSYFGDFDSDNNFLRGPLASTTYGLASMWSGRPLWFVHPMGVGETIGYCAKLSQNNNTGGVYSQQNHGTRGVHVALMGDPTLRMHPVIPPSNLTVNGGVLSWNASTDTSLVGYHVYRASSANGPFTRATTTLVSGTTFTDSVSGTYTYMVRAIKLERSGSGSYFNASQGVFANGSSSGSSGENPDTGSVPGAPSNVAATIVSTSQVDLSWDEVANASGFKIERKTGQAGTYGQIVSVNAGTSRYSNTGLTANTEYFYRVRAFNAAGNSPYSVEIGATTSSNTETNSPTDPKTNSVAGSSAVLIKVDATTQGNWKSQYGGEGYEILSDTARYPSFVQLLPSGKGNWTWSTSTSDARCLQKGGSSDRVAGCWYSTATFTIDLNFTDGKTHQFAIYCLDWDRNGRSETVEVLDADSGSVLSTRTLSDFGSGKYVVWNIKGHVKVTVTRNSGVNSVVSGIFFDAAGGVTGPEPNPTPEPEPEPEPVTIAAPTISPTGGVFTNSVAVSLKAETGTIIRYTLDGSAPTSGSTLYSAPFTLTDSTTVKAIAFGSGTNSVVTSLAFTRAVAEPAPEPETPTNTVSKAAVFVKVDGITKGNWKGIYGTEGAGLSAVATDYPSYAQVTASGKGNWLWAWSTTDARALQKIGSTDRAASCWYSAASFTVDVTITDGKAHRVALYFLDWDTNNRAEKIEAIDAATGQVLDTRWVKTFNGGKYLVWDIKGKVKFKFTRTGGYNAVLNGIFFGPSPSV